ncbi:CBS domain-containing protein [bacterium]|nr:MAG: CBS domain-containing protein [bacterium]
MTKSVMTIPPAMPLSEVAELMHSHGFHGVPVVNEQGTVLGMITEKELFSSDSKFYLPGFMRVLQDTKFLSGQAKELPYAAQQLTKISAQDVMSRNTYFLHPEIEVDELAEIFVNYNQSPIPVVDHANKLLGIVSRSDLVRLLAPPTPKHDKGYYDTLRKNASPRAVDRELNFVRSEMGSKFAMVAKARANIWLTAVIVLFIAGFFIGIIYVADPDILLQNKAPVRNSRTEPPPSFSK